MSSIDVKTEGLRIGVSGAVITVAGVSLNEWVAVFTIIYLVCQTLILLPKVHVIVKHAIRWLKVFFKQGDNDA